jgi:peptidyl-prolyl cis-trans isomerase A (cyclophilin A)
MRWTTLIVAGVAGAAQAVTTAGPSRGPQVTPPPVRVVLETATGVIEMDVDVGRAPVTAANFLRYVDAGLYDGGVFHRAVRPDTQVRDDVPIQVIQGRMRRGPGRGQGPRPFEPIALERTSVTGLVHLDGTVSMARSAPDSATHEFFICIGDQPELDFGGRRNADGQGFAAFGRVVRGMDVVRAIQAAPVRPRTETLDPVVPIVRASRTGRGQPPFQKGPGDAILFASVRDRGEFEAPRRP